MDETIADSATRDEWEKSYNAAKLAYGDRFEEMFPAAQKALAELTKNEKLTKVVDEQITKMLQEAQLKILMLRAAAFKAIPE